MDKIKLVSLKIHEQSDASVEFDVPEFSIEDFNLLIGDNAQGKSRLIRILSFIKYLFFEGKQKRISTNFKSEFIFDRFSDDTKTDSIKYSLAISPTNEGNEYDEIVKGENILYLSSKEKKVYDDLEKKHLESFFVPKNTLSVSAIDDKRFETIALIRQFFQRIIFVSAEKEKYVIPDPNALVVNENGTNIADVLNSWSKTYPDNFNEVISKFKECFSFVTNVEPRESNISGPLKHLLLFFSEKDIKIDIPQTEMSNGMFRLLQLLCPSNTLFEFNGNLIGPSLICIDEVENGLDYKTLKFILQYLKEESDKTQIILTTHTPLIINFVRPEYWKVVKRNGPTINIIYPAKVEQDLDAKLHEYKNDYWEFYNRHIRSSHLYEEKKK